MKFSYRCLQISLFLVLCSATAVAQNVALNSASGLCQQTAAWQGTFVDGSPLTQAKLDELLTAHTKWLETAFEEMAIKIKLDPENQEYQGAWLKESRILLASDWGADEGRLVLKGASLRCANLEKANLMYANLEKADLLGANLREANLSNTNLRKARLIATNLEGAELRGADLEKANLKDVKLENAKLGGFADLTGSRLEGANLKQADLGDAILEGVVLVGAYLGGTDLRNANLKAADLGGANLEEANLEDTNLAEANLKNSDLRGVTYEVKLKQLPKIVSLRNVKNLEKMRFKDTPHALEDLRHNLKEMGYRQQERQITYALKRSEYDNAIKDGKWFEPFFLYWLFDWPVQYGLDPFGALKIISFLIIGFSIIYTLFLFAGSKKHGIWQIWPKDSVGPNIGLEGLDRLIIHNWHNWHNWRDWWCTIRYAFYFSLLSAFHIGWREFSIGNWMAQLQLRPYTLQPTGWVRFFSGLESLLSVYLLAMWFLTYFGRPFE